MLTALAAFFVYVVYDTTVKFGQQPPVSPFLIMSIVGFVCSACLVGFAYASRTPSILRPTRWREQGLTAAAHVLMNFSVVIALKHLPLTLFYVLFFTAPLVIAILSAFLKHEVLTPRKIACLVAGFIGTVLAIGVQDGSYDFMGLVAVSTGVLGFSARALFIRHMGKTVTTISTILMCNIAVGICGVLGLLVSGAGTSIETRAVLIFILSGSMAALGSILYFKAIQNTLSTNVAQLHYTQVIFGAIFGYILWRDMPTWNLIAGSIIIIASGIFLAAEARKTEKGVGLR